MKEKANDQKYHVNELCTREMSGRNDPSPPPNIKTNEFPLLTIPLPHPLPPLEQQRTLPNGPKPPDKPNVS